MTHELAAEGVDGRGKHSSAVIAQNGTSHDALNTKHPSHEKETNSKVTGYAIAETTLPQWINLTLMLSLIFGGCCSNVLALEALIRYSALLFTFYPFVADPSLTCARSEVPSSTTLLTLTQFLLTTFFSLYPQLSLSAGLRNLFLKPRAIPLRYWIFYTLFFATINILNNRAFNYKISLPLHVILRSAGPVTSMFIGWLVAGKRYTRLQVIAVGLLFLGVVVAGVCDSWAKKPPLTTSLSIPTTNVSATTTLPSSSDGESGIKTQAIGFLLLFLALLLSAIMGIYTDTLYSRYGRSHWNENLFYSHALSLPLFLFSYADLSRQISDLFTASPTISTFLVQQPQTEILPLPLLPTLPLPSWLHALRQIPLHPTILLANAMTQYICIRGVNLLSSQTSSLTVTIVLNVRKLVSLLLSIVIFGNRLPFGVVVGASMVFAGVGLWGVAPGVKKKKKQKEKVEEGNGIDVEEDVVMDRRVEREEDGLRRRRLSGSDDGARRGKHGDL